MNGPFAWIRVNGPKASKDYDFLIVRGVSAMGLPAAEIEELGLTRIPNGRRVFSTPEGPAKLDSYMIVALVADQGFADNVVPAPVPRMGSEMLWAVGFRVNPVTGELEDVRDDPLHRYVSGDKTYYLRPLK